MPPETTKQRYLITVHGTATPGAAIDDGRWWQPDSAFCQAVAERFDGIRVEPFRWGGAYSEKVRRVKAQELADRIQEMTKENEVILVGHSHGGSVIDLALRYAKLTSAQRANVSRWVTVGTPFLRMRPKRLFGIPYLSSPIASLSTFRRGLAIALLLVAMTLNLVIEAFDDSENKRTATIIADAETTVGGFEKESIDDGQQRQGSGNQFSDGSNQPAEQDDPLETRSESAKLEDKIQASEAARRAMRFIFLLAFISAIPTRLDFFTLYAPTSLALFKRRFSEKWRGVWHPDDEAINLLKTGSRARGKIVPKAFAEILIVLVFASAAFLAIFAPAWRVMDNNSSEGDPPTVWTKVLNDTVITNSCKFDYFDGAFWALTHALMGGTDDDDLDDEEQQRCYTDEDTGLPWSSDKHKLKEVFKASTVIFVVSAAFLFFAVAVARLISDLFATRWSDNFVLTWLRKRIVGHDVDGEFFERIRKAPRGVSEPTFGVEAGRLSDEMQDRMIDYTKGKADEGLQTLRRSLTIFSGGVEDEAADDELSIDDLGRQVAARLTMDFLVHNAYFEDEAVREHIADIIAGRVD